MKECSSGPIETLCGASHQILGFIEGIFCFLDCTMVNHHQTIFKKLFVYFVEAPQAIQDVCFQKASIQTF